MSKTDAITQQSSKRRSANNDPNRLRYALNREHSRHSRLDCARPQSPANLPNFAIKSTSEWQLLFNVYRGELQATLPHSFYSGRSGTLRTLLDTPARTLFKTRAQITPTKVQRIDTSAWSEKSRSAQTTTSGPSSPSCRPCTTSSSISCRLISLNLSPTTACLAGCSADLQHRRYQTYRRMYQRACTCMATSESYWFKMHTA